MKSHETKLDFATSYPRPLVAAMHARCTAGFRSGPANPTIMSAETGPSGSIGEGCPPRDGRQMWNIE
jgi:hypothetical protein